MDLCIMAVMVLYIFRHGETYQTLHKQLYGDKVEIAEILPNGIPVIKKLGNYLKDRKTDANYTSPYLRCVQTVEIISQVSGKVFLTEDRLGEYRKERENYEQFVERISSFYEHLKNQNLNAAAICTHGYPISALIQLATKDKVSRGELDNYPRPGILTIIRNGQSETIDLN